MVTDFTANYASALAFELRRGPAPEDRDFLRIKFKNGTNDNFQTFHAFGHKADIPLTEFFYRSEVSWYPRPASRFHLQIFSPCVQNYAITSYKQWAATCQDSLQNEYLHIGSENGMTSTVMAACSAALFVGIIALAKFVKRSRAKKYVRLPDDEVSRGPCNHPSYGSTLPNVSTRPFLLTLY